MIFVDASALIAIIAGEADADRVADILEDEPDRLCSAVSVWETIAGLCRSHGLTIDRARDHVRRFLDEGRFIHVALGEETAEIALEAYARFGKGRHPAALNMGDCFAYAAAKENGARLL